MVQTAEQRKEETIQAIIRQVSDKLEGERATQAARFVRHFYAHVSPADLLGMNGEQLYGAALALWQFAQQRPAATVRLRIYNPRIESTGWQSAHTVIEAVNDDMPFLVDSMVAELGRLGLTVHLVIHPVVPVQRDNTGKMTALPEIGTAQDDSFPRESIMHIAVSPISDPAVLANAEARLLAVLKDVRNAVTDWPAMRLKVREALSEAEAARAKLPAEEVSETEAFLEWADDDHFTFLGYREYRFHAEAGREDEPGLSLVDGSGLGILRDDAVTVFDGLRHFSTLPPDVQAFLRAPRFLMLSKGNQPSTVHRPVPLDTILVKRFAPDGAIIGERLFAGLFTSAAYNRSPRQIPFLRRKLADVITRSGFPQRSHDGKALVNILETYPRDELFQIGEDTLYDIAIGIVHLQERQRLALFVRRDPFERFVSCLVYVPRDRYDTALRQRFQALLEAAFCGTAQTFYTQLAESPLARVHFIIQTEPGNVPVVDVGALEETLTNSARGWVDKLHDALIASHGEEMGAALFARYGHAFPTSYREMFSAEQAVSDIDRIEAGVDGQRLGLNLYRSLEARSGELHFKIYHAGHPVALSDVLPMLEHMDLRVITESPFEVRPKGRGEPVWLHDFTTEVQLGTAGINDDADTMAVKEPFQEAFAAVWEGRAEDDGFNRLILRAGLTFREVALLRAWAKYLRQARFTYGQDTIEATLTNHPDAARILVRLFHLWHDPTGGRDDEEADALEAMLMADMHQALEAVTNLDQDRVLRRLLNVVMSIVRTNYYQPGADGKPKPYIAFKLDSQALVELPLPRPLVEVFVYSPRMEGIHLRGGRVARGGIRWSDRREDFRTEILGLMKAQMVKNSVIVPVGSKGGFVLKRPPPASAGREAFQAEGIECYKLLIQGLLDVTDNLDADGTIVPPENVRRLDEDDPYLVVAADKGTATFSDIANSLSVAHGFWLGDAFASGGSAGYDHKKMGITARGAWECVKRHFREIGTDIQAQDFTCVGVGDMSGDVFGNGMLLSAHTRLLAAFDHRHIFIDPDPDPTAAWEERKRLFDLPRSSWMDYDKSKLSAGARIYDRGAKSLALTPEIRACFGLAAETITPQELMQALLRARVDLLWFGGIGTYVKAASETHADAGDKANDAIRVNANTLQAQVIGEGANLGMTQRARVEANARGIRLNTDAIDNSAGVDTSDHEVNIKILLDDVVRRGDMTDKQRNQVLASMTDEVAQLVLSDNYLQSQAISVAVSQGPALLDSHGRFMRGLEKAGRLDRSIEFLPDDEELALRTAQGRGLTRPEVAVLLGYAKLTLFDALLDSDLPDDPFMEQDLVRYFPTRLHEPFADAIGRHRLRREIIATQVTNSMVNRVGPGFVKDMMDKTGFGPADVARAYAIVRDAFGLRGLWSAIEGLDNRAPADAQTALIVETIALMERTVAWFLTHAGHPLDVAAITAAYRPGIETLAADLDRVLDEKEAAKLAERTAGLVERGVPMVAARRIAALPVLAAGPDLVLIAGKTARPLEDVAAVYFLLGRRFGLEWLRDRAAAAKADNHWQRQALGAIIDDLFGLQTQLTVRVLEAHAESTNGALVERWAEDHRMAVERSEVLLSELHSQPAVDMAMLAVANRQLRSLTAV